MESMIEELRRYGFQKMPGVTHYDPDHRIHDFYMERKRAYVHKPLSGEEPFRNVVNESKLKKIRLKVHQDVRKMQATVEANINKRTAHTRKDDIQVSTSKVTQVPQTIQESVGQYASMRGKRPIEQVVEQVKATMDIHDAQDLEHVATQKMVRCVRNEKKDTTPPARPSRKVMPPPSTTIPASSSPSSSPLYASNDELERKEGEDEVSDSEDGQGEEDKPEDEPVLSTASGDELHDAQSDDESLEILGGVDKSVPVEALETREKGKAVETEPASKVTQLQRPSHSQTPQT